jgi:glutaredoxin
VLLQELVPEIVTDFDVANLVIVVGTPECPKCTRTGKLFDAKGIKWAKYAIEDSHHPILVALRERLGVAADKPIDLPVVFVDGEYRWHDLNPVEISALAKSLAIAA